MVPPITKVSETRLIYEVRFGFPLLFYLYKLNLTGRLEERGGRREKLGFLAWYVSVGDDRPFLLIFAYLLLVDVLTTFAGLCESPC